MHPFSSRVMHDTACWSMAHHSTSYETNWRMVPAIAVCWHTVSNWCLELGAHLRLLPQELSSDNLQL